MNRFPLNSAVALAVSTVLGTGAAHAITAPNPPQFVIYAGGGSAEPQAVQAAACQLFTAGTSGIGGTGVDSFSSGNGDFLALYGTTAADIKQQGTSTVEIPAGSSLLLIYSYKGGSYANGAVPQQNVTPLKTLTYPTINSILGAPVQAVANNLVGTACLSSANNGGATYTYTEALSNPQTPSFGLTDVEVSAFAGINNPSPPSLVTVGAAAPSYDLVFGWAATTALYAKKTNFTTAEIRGILTGVNTDWNAILADSGAPVAVAGTGIPLIDRNVGSGTKTSGTSLYLGYPQLGAIAALPNSVSGLGPTPFNGPLVAGQFVQAAADVIDSSATAVAQDLTNLQGAGVLAIGRLSADNAPYLHQCGAGVNCYNFVKINGVGVDSGAANDNINGAVQTSYINVVQGNYPDFFQVSFNTHGTIANATPGDAFAAAFQTILTNGSIIGCIQNAKFPLAAPGLVLDGDIPGLAYGKGVTIVSRKENSDGPLQLVKTTETYAGCTDPL